VHAFSTALICRGWLPQGRSLQGSFLSGFLPPDSSTNARARARSRAVEAAFSSHIAAHAHPLPQSQPSGADEVPLGMYTSNTWTSADDAPTRRRGPAERSSSSLPTALDRSMSSQQLLAHMQSAGIADLHSVEAAAAHLAGEEEDAVWHAKRQGLDPNNLLSSLGLSPEPPSPDAPPVVLPPLVMNADGLDPSWPNHWQVHACALVCVCEQLVPRQHSFSHGRSAYHGGTPLWWICIRHGHLHVATHIRPEQCSAARHQLTTPPRRRYALLAETQRTAAVARLDLLQPI
jgi:hypothetical protein